ncbi:MAG: hypothetical protein VW930_07790 [Burkholderiaceae bacterium]|jgi:hypothetical protein
MSEFTIDGQVYETDDLDTTQKRVVALYQRALREEGEAAASLEIARAARVELGKKMQELVIKDSNSKQNNKKKK